MFTARAHGLTLRRAAEAALARPHPGPDRFDPDFKVAFRCSRCKKLGVGPRRHMREAIKEHLENDCEARRTKADAPQVMRLLYPRQ